MELEGQLNDNLVNEKINYLKNNRDYLESITSEEKQNYADSARYSITFTFVKPRKAK